VLWRHALCAVLQAQTLLYYGNSVAGIHCDASAASGSQVGSGTTYSRKRTPWYTGADSRSSPAARGLNWTGRVCGSFTARAMRGTQASDRFEPIDGGSDPSQLVYRGCRAKLHPPPCVARVRQQGAGPARPGAACLVTIARGMAQAGCLISRSSHGVVRVTSS
jgi:hypothetical protein